MEMLTGWAEGNIPAIAWAWLSESLDVVDEWQTIRSAHHSGEGTNVGAMNGWQSDFTDPAVLILSSLASGEKHGYALIKDIESFAYVTLGPGTLYGALARLEERGLVQALAADERRRPYRLTAVGAKALHTYLSHARSVTEIGIRRLAAGT